jgi:DNA-binding response OmpR family regulator
MMLMATPAAGERTARTPTVLVIEDDPNVRTVLLMMLGTMPYRALSAADGAEGLRVAMTERPELILLDAELPLLHGFEVCRLLKVAPETRGTTIIIVSAKTEPADIARGMASGADDYVTKPFSVSALRQKIRQALEPAGA